MPRPSTSAAGPADQLVDGFIGHLRSERGVSALTVEAYVSDVRRFLADRGETDLSGLTAAEVSHAVLSQVGVACPCVGAPLRVRGPLVPALLLFGRSRRPRPVGRRVAGVGKATVAVATGHHAERSDAVAAGVRSAEAEALGVDLCRPERDHPTA